MSSRRRISNISSRPAGSRKAGEYPISNGNNQEPEWEPEIQKTLELN